MLIYEIVYRPIEHGLQQHEHDHTKRKHLAEKLARAVTAALRSAYQSADVQQCDLKAPPDADPTDPSATAPAPMTKK